jgi:hypothetical protein
MERLNERGHNIVVDLAPDVLFNAEIEGVPCHPARRHAAGIPSVWPPTVGPLDPDTPTRQQISFLDLLVNPKQQP